MTQKGRFPLGSLPFLFSGHPLPLGQGEGMVLTQRGLRLQVPDALTSLDEAAMCLPSTRSAAQSWAIAVLLTLGCTHSASRSSEPRPATPATTDERQGCRAPDEPGCAQCCEPVADNIHDCVVRTWNRVGVSDQELAASGTLPWYNATSGADTWPTGCPACARCLKREEKELRALGDRPACDCTRPVGNDPCMVPGSCECYCRRVLELSRSCPSVAPARIRALAPRQPD